MLLYKSAVSQVSIYNIQQSAFWCIFEDQQGESYMIFKIVVVLTNLPV